MKINTTIPSTFPEGTSVQNTGVGLLQLPEGHTKISGNSASAAIGVVMNGGFPGQFPKSTRMSTADGFGKVIEIKR